MHTVFLHRYGNRPGARLAAVLLLGLLGALVCGAALAARQVHIVRIEGMQFSPAVLEARPGDTVAWQNRDIVPHNVTAADRRFHSPTLAPNGTWRYQVRKKGEYAYLCTLHPVMKAKLIVR